MEKSMSTEIVQYQAPKPGLISRAVTAMFTRDKVDLIKRTVAKGATDDELALFLHQAQRTGLDPLARQIYFQKRRSKSNGDQVTILVGIDGYRVVANRTGLYAGNDDPVFDDEANPRKATVTVYKMIGGQRCPFTATARWEQYYPGDAQGFMWRKMPHLMLGKCAEALALRKAFPAELSGVYVKEEMDQAGPPIDDDSVPSDQVLEGVPDRGVPYDPDDPDHKKFLWGILKGKNITNAEDTKKINDAMRGKYEDEIEDVIKDFLVGASKL
jgi:phage recombination protein Bet